MLYKKFKLFFEISMLSFIASGAGLLFVPFANINQKGFEKALGIFIALLFWGGIICGIFFLLKTNERRRLLESRLARKKIQTATAGRLGVLSFFKNKIAMIADIVFAVSVVSFILCVIFAADNAWACIILIVLLYWSFTLHCFLNGKNFFYIFSYKKYADE